MPFIAKRRGLLLPLSLFAVLVSVPDGQAQQAQKSSDECVGLVCTMQRSQQEAAAAPQVARPREPCVGILCKLTGESTEAGGQATQASDELVVPHTGLFGAVFSGGDRAQPAPPASIPAPSAEPAAPDALPAFNGSAQSEIISEGVNANASAESGGRHCLRKTNDPWECAR